MFLLKYPDALNDPVYQKLAKIEDKLYKFKDQLVY